MSVTGVVKSYNPHKGWGFIECNGQDVFVNRKDTGGFSLSTGNQVQFTVTSTEKGAAAVNVRVLAPPEEASYFGEIKSFNPSKGFGFISCEAFPGQDVFVLRTDLPGGMAPQGGHCRFKVKMEPKGPMAADVQLLGAAGNQVQQMKSMGMLGWGKGGGKGWGMPPMPPWGFSPMMMLGKGFGKSKGKGLSKVDPAKKVWIGQLAEGVDWRALQEHMDKAGKTRWVEVFKGKGKGTAAAAYSTEEDAAKAVATLNGSVLGGAVLVVDAWAKKAA